MQKWIVNPQDSQLNATLLIALISPVIIQDYEFQENGLVCFFTQSISHLQIVIKTFLDALYELTNKRFYFEVINDQKAILRIYGLEELQFVNDILFQSSISS
ncbi:MAG: hypothetical protein ACFFFH_12135 [Candidatus Thorarchaeota archaeon]